MTTITPPNISINGVALAMHQYMETRVQTTLQQAEVGSLQSIADLNALRKDAATEAGVNPNSIVPE